MTTKELYFWGMKGPWFKEESTDTEWKYLEEDDTLYMAFQGSTSPMDWKQNFSFWIKPYKRMKHTWFAHSGFIKKWKSIEKEVISHLIKTPCKQIKVVGFSQGGAVATLCHESIKYNSFFLVDTYLFGSPRVVWFWNYKKIKNRFEGIQNYQINKDVITKLPPWIFGYKHVGKKFILKSKYFIWQLVKNHMNYGEAL